MTTDPATRIRHGSIANLLRDLTLADHAILATVAQHRFVTCRHVQVLHFAERPSELAGVRAAGRALRRLVDLGVLATLERRIGGVRAGSSGMVYRVGPQGRKVVARDSGQRLPRFQAEPSTAFLTHTLAVADVHAELVRQANAGRLELIEFVTEPACWRTYLNAGGGRETLKPDAFVVWVKAGDDYETVAFIEVDMGSESIPRLLRKCRQYETYRRTGKEQATQGVWPRVIWIVHDSTRKQRLEVAIGGCSGIDSGVFSVSLADFSSVRSS
ncbi:MAG: replication-relaxation family protein [Micrococcales bacterium]|nr:replication-relaxation family protein [Micrococcales bacterium]